MLFSVGEVLLELVVELPQRVGPLLLAVFDLVEFFFETSRVLRIEYVLEVLNQQIGDDQADFRRDEFSAAPGLLHVLALLDRAHDGRVRRRSADAALFEFFHQRRLVETRRRSVKCCSGLRLFSVSFCPSTSSRQLVLERLVFLVLGVLGFLVNLQETIELQHRSGDAEVDSVSLTVLGIDVDRRLIEDRRRHLRSQKTLPDQFVDLASRLPADTASVGQDDAATAVGRIASCASCAPCSWTCRRSADRAETPFRNRCSISSRTSASASFDTRVESVRI